jgi:hypothetical protein
MADDVRVRTWMEPSLPGPGARRGRENRFTVAKVYSNKSSSWYQVGTSGDPIQAFAEIGKIDAMKSLAFVMVKKHVSHNFFKEALAKKTQFTVTVGWVLEWGAGSGKSGTLKELIMVYYDAKLDHYLVDEGFEEGRISFQSSAEMTVQKYTPKAS